MTLYLGKRSPGLLTKASPGDTLYIPFATYNDSGASIRDTGLSHDDVEIYKNNETTARATDSGVWLGDSGVNYEVAGTRVTAANFSDTGQYGDVIGLYSIGIRLFNTSDDTGFFDAGSSYHVTIQGLAVKSGQGYQEVNFIPAMFEIAGVRVQAGAPAQQGAVSLPIVDVRAIDGDTGPADNLGRIAGDTGTGSYLWRHRDTGGIADAIWAYSARVLTSFAFDTGVWGSNAARTLTAFQFDTGIWGSNFASGRTLTSFLFDTGIRDTVWRASPSAYTSDTGSAGYALGRLMAVNGDTGAAHLDGGRLGVSATATLDTGVVNRAVWNADASRTLTAFAFDTGVWGSNVARTLTAFQFDTGVWGSNFASGRTLTSFLFDTGIRDTILKTQKSAYDTDTGSITYAFGNILEVRGDTGAAHLDQGRFGVISDSGRMAAVLDTGKVAAAVWTSHATRTLTAFAFDTGIWGSNFSGGRQLTSFGFDTGVAQTVWRSSTSAYTSDTGSVAYAQGRVMAVRNDTGAAHLDQGRFGVLSDSGVAAAVLDTGKVASAVWTSHATRTLTAFQFDTGVWGSNAARTLTAFAHDTGVADTVWKYATRTVDVTKIDGDTGPADNLGRLAGDTGTGSLFASWTADTLLDRNMATGADNGSTTVRTPRQALRALRNRVEMDTGAIVVFKEDDATASWTGTLETDTGAVPVKTVNPAGP